MPEGRADMTHEQQNEIIAHVASGATWAQAATLAGIHPEQLMLHVLAAKQGTDASTDEFVKDLEAAGREATANSLKKVA